jgi:uncharacterized lipoprotein YddW (UPF0748 family)
MLKFIQQQLHSTKAKRWFGIRYRWLILILLSFWFTISVWQAPIVNLSKSNSEIHGIWITNFGVALNYYTTRLDEAVANIAKHNLNTVYPAVWNRGYTLHPSNVAKKVSGSERYYLTSLPLLPFQDALRELVKQTRRQHLRVIPWFEYGLMVPKNHPITRRHPEWLTQTASGSKVSKESNESMSWLNPCHPEVQKFLTNLIVDVVKRYQVDGIQLDDHFALPVQFGYDAYTVELYKKEHFGKAPPTNYNNSEWMAWRAEKLTQLMKKISQEVKIVRKNAVISLSPNSPTFAYNKYLQNWEKWVNQGLLDEVIVQVYRDELKSFKSELQNDDLLSMKNKIPIAIGLYTGPFLDVKPIDRVKQEIKIVKDSAYKGISFFCWETTLWFFKGGSHHQVEQSFRKLLN